MNHFDTPEQAALFFAAKALSEGYVFKCLHPYVDANGQIIFWRIRCKDSNGEKWIRAMHQDEIGQYHLCEPSHQKDNLKPLYGLQILAQNPNAIIWLPEGEHCVDVFNQYFNSHSLTHLHIALTSGGATSNDKADWQPLTGKTVILWPDNDEPGKLYSNAVAKILNELGCTIQVIDISTLNLPIHGDVVDWLELNLHATIDDILAIPTITQAEFLKEDKSNPDLVEENESGSQSTMLVAFVVSEARLFHDLNGYVYAQYNNTHETRRLDGRQFKDWLVANFYQKTTKSPREQSIREAISTLSGLARIQGECQEVHVRVGMHDGSYFLDLAEPGLSRAVKISAGKWEIINNPPICFLRPEAMSPLPEPIAGGNILELSQLINIPEDTNLLVIAWLVDALRPDTPFPVLELIGEQGSAKSTTQEILRQLIDPSTCNLRVAPKTSEDVFVSAGVNWVVSYENISHLSPSMQDTFCTIATGAGFAKRKLYSDADESIIKAKRPIIINGISVAITSQDLVDRTLSIETPVITERREITELLHNYEAKRGQLLGALLDTMAKALSILPSIKLPAEDRPRLLEFVRLGMALAKAVGESSETFLAQFNAARQEALSRTIEASPVALALIDWFQQCERNIKVEMSLKDLFQAVEKRRPSNNTDSWPRSPKGFADALRRAAPALRQIGIVCRSLGKRGSYVYWEVAPRI